MKNIRVTETFNRGTVRGIGKLNPAEVPALTWDGSLTCGLYLIDFSKALNKLTDARVVQRSVQTIEDFVNTILLNENGLQLDIMRKVKLSQDPQTGIIDTDLEIFASIKRAFITRESMDISESQITGRDVDFTYIDPITNPQ
jgi:hypothetical protein